MSVVKGHQRPRRPLTRAGRITLTTGTLGLALGAAYMLAAPRWRSETQRDTTSEDSSNSAGRSLITASSPQEPDVVRYSNLSLLSEIRISAGGTLWPTFSPKILNYEVELDTPLHQDVRLAAPWVEFEAILGDSCRQSQNSSECRVFIDGEVVPVDAEGKGSKRVQLPHLTSTSALPYQLILVEAFEVPAGQKRMYAVRVLQPPDDAQAVDDEVVAILDDSSNSSSRALLANAAVQQEVDEYAVIEHDRDPPLSGTATVMTPVSMIGLRIINGDCMRAPGPFKESAVPNVKGVVDIWGKTRNHVLCFMDEPDASAGNDSYDACVESDTDKCDSSKVHFIATLLKPHSSPPGAFGFGKGVEAGILPSIETDVLWPLQAGVRSIGLKVRNHVGFRTLGFHYRALADEQKLPVIVARSYSSQPISVHFVNAHDGTCSSISGRFVCRTTEDIKGKPVHLIVFCSRCAKQASHDHDRWTVSVLEQKKRMVAAKSPTKLVHEKVPQDPNSKIVPWLGWSTSIPAKSQSRQWAVTLQQQKRTVSEDSPVEDSWTHVGTMHVQIALVTGNTTVEWIPSWETRCVFRFAGVVLSYMMLATVFVQLLLLIQAARGRPAPVLAAQPATLSAVTLLQLLALSGDSKQTPLLICILGKPVAWLSPGPSGFSLSTLVLAMCLIGFFHTCAVCRHFVANGNGAAKSLPHGLAFGAWELRALSYIILPLSVLATNLIVSLEFGPSVLAFVFEQTGRVIWAVVGIVILAVLLVIGQRCWDRVSTWLMDEAVICLYLPDTQFPIFVDRICNQLRALPMRPGMSSLLGDWPATPGWCSAPAVAAIQDVEHRGHPCNKAPIGSYKPVWSHGPWSTPNPTLDTEAGRGDVASEERGASALAREKRLSRGLDYPQPRREHSTSSMASSATLISRSSSQTEKQKERVGAACRAHPIKVVTKFVYKGRHFGRITGVTGLPWLNAAIPSEALVGLEQLLQEVEFRAQVGQLCGPLASGRLGACFDWGTRWPWRWPADALLKVVLGVYMGIFPLTLEATWAGTWWACGLHSVVASIAVLLASWCGYHGPYVHPIDNISVAAVLLTVPAATLAQLFGDSNPTVALAVSAVILLMAMLPLTAALVASLVAAGLAQHWQYQDLHDWIVPRLVKDWGSDMESRTDVANVVGLFWEEAPVKVSKNIETSSGGFLRFVSSAIVAPESLSPEPRIELPSEVLPSVVRTQLRPPPLPGGKCAHLADGNKRPQLPMPLNLLFSSPSGGRTRTSGVMTQERIAERSAVPMVAVITPDDGCLVYSQDTFPSDCVWQETLRDFFHPGDRVVSDEVERIVQLHLERQDQDRIGQEVDQAIVLVEVLAPGPFTCR